MLLAFNYKQNKKKKRPLSDLFDYSPKEKKKTLHVKKKKKNLQRLIKSLQVWRKVYLRIRKVTAGSRLGVPWPRLRVSRVRIVLVILLIRKGAGVHNGLLS